MFLCVCVCVCVCVCARARADGRGARQVTRALEWLEGDKSDAATTTRRYAAVLVVRVRRAAVGVEWFDSR